jgi:diguanylate cyclase (GGDEF)-like protein
MSLENRAPTADPLDKAPDGQALPVPRLLIVDDVEDNRTVLARRFARRGYHIVEADCGRTALRLIHEQEFDLVLLDVMMPDLLGTEVLREIRHRFNAVTLPVIMVTARAASDDIVEALQLGANDYITKPVDFAIALARVTTQIARRRAELQMLETAEALYKSKEVLEDRVRERTSDLVRINAQLRDEIVQRERSEAETRYLALHDALTGLANRSLFAQRLRDEISALEPGRGLALLYIDLDGFKGVNDTLGHSVGDKLLCQIAERLRAAAPAQALIGRLGGDEFAVLLPPPATLETASALAATIVQQLADLTSIDEDEVRIGASIGIAPCERADHDLNELLRSADIAMYCAKSDGRGTWRVYDASMDEAARQRRQLEIDMRRALAVGDFRVYFQPIVTLQDMRVSAFEALLRWDHATRGVITTEDFIRLAEETRLIIPIGEWMLREACRHAMNWPEEINVAVNISPIQFTRGHVVAAVAKALTETRLRPSRLEIEVTEAALSEQPELILSLLQDLRALGVRISIDGFGTGYSSLKHLRSFPFDKIKIDRTFMHGVIENADNQAIVHAIATIGSQLGLTTTVEGVETVEQLGYITKEGCTEVQGRFFSMPVPAPDVARVLGQIQARKKP